ncbi:MAG: DNA polymerase Y family protein [Planctomycetota bacterium]
MSKETDRTIAIWLPDWPVQRVRHKQIELREAAIVFSSGDGRSEAVVACSPEVRRLGVSIGMRTPDAESLAGPGRLTVFEHDPGSDRRLLVRLGEACERFSPSVALENADYPEALLLNAKGIAVLWGETEAEGENRLLRAIEEWLGSERLEGVVAMASTVSMALAVARYREAISRQLQEPAHVLGSEQRVLDHLPVAALRIDEATNEKLRSLGINTVARLLELPRSMLPARFGSELVHRLDQLLGRAPEPLETVVSDQPIEVDWSFENAVRSGSVLEATVDQMLDQIASELQRRGRGVLRVAIRYDLDSSPPSALPVTLRVFRPIASARELKELAVLQTEGLRFPAAVKEIHVLVGSTAPLDVRQRRLFDDDASDDPHETAKLINRLANRVGYDRVSRVEKRRSVDPKRSYACLPATDTPSQGFDLTTHQARRLLRMPLAMKGEAGHPISVAVNDDGAPDVVSGCQVVRSWGPERVETGWWRGRAVRRDAYWVELENGSRLWLTQDLYRRVWRLAGEFV